IRGASSGIRDGNWFQSVENEAAALAAENFFVGFRAQFLKNVRQDAHAGRAALPVSGFGQGRTVVALGDARVKFAQIFGHGSDDFFAFGGGGLELFFLFCPLRLNLFSFRNDGLLRFFQSRFRNLYAAFGFFRGHHYFQLAVFGFRNFGFGGCRFVLPNFFRFFWFFAAAFFALFSPPPFPFFLPHF